MGEIDTVLLGDIAEITAGQSPPGFTINRSGDGVPFFQGAKDFGARYPQVRTYTTAPARLASPGDILLSVRAPIGRVNRCQAKCAIGRGVSALRSRSEIALTDYLEYWLRAYEPRWYQHESAGSVFSNLSTTELLHLELSLPPLSEQRAIAEVLGALDDKIEANRRLSNLCDALWQTMAAEVFDDIEDGVITSGDLQPLSSIATFVNGKAFTKDATGTGRMVVRIAELNSGPGASTIYNEIEVPAEHIAAPGDLLFAWSGSLTVQRWYRPEAIIKKKKKKKNKEEKKT
jgi:type I restriction enzyme S subunit